MLLALHYTTLMFWFFFWFLVCLFFFSCMVLCLGDWTNFLSALLLFFSHNRPHRSSWNSQLLIPVTGSRTSFNSCKHNTTGADGNADTHRHKRERNVATYPSRKAAARGHTPFTLYLAFSDKHINNGGYTLNLTTCTKVSTWKPTRYWLEIWVLMYWGLHILVVHRSLLEACAKQASSLDTYSAHYLLCWPLLYPGDPGVVDPFGFERSDDNNIYRSASLKNSEYMCSH